MHSQLIEQTGGIDGIRDEGLLESAIPPTMRLCSRYFFCFFSAILQFTFFITHAQSVILETSAMKDGTEYGLLNVKKRKVTVSEVGEFKKSLTERGELARSFHATRVSPSGAIVVDDNLGLFIAGDDPYAPICKKNGGYREIQACD